MAGRFIRNALFMINPGVYMLRKFLCFFLLTGVLMSGTARAEGSAPYLTRLPNGLSVLFYKDDRFPLVSLRLYVHAGSSYESAKEFGLSHLLEHMVFKGTSKRPKGAVAADIEAAGGYVNAATSFDYTLYLADMPADEWKTGLDVLKDAAFDPTLDKDELEAEKDVVLAELKRGEDSPAGLIFKRLNESLFAGTPYGHPIIGYPEVIKSITREDMLDYIGRHYQPQNMLMLVCGNADQAEVLAEIERQFGGLANNAKTDALPPVGADLATPAQRVRVESGDWNKVYLGLAFPLPEGGSLESNQVDLLAQLLGGDKTSYFYRKYKYAERLVDSIAVMNYGFERTGMFYVYVELEADKLPVFWEKFVADLRGIPDLTFTQEEFERARVNMEDDLYRSKETVAGLASKLGYFYFFGDGERDEADYVQALRSTDGSALSSLAKKYLRPEKLSVAVLLPKGAEKNISQEKLLAELDKAWPARAETVKTASASSSAPGSVEVVELGPGRKVVLLPDGSLPYISGSLTFTGGNSLLSTDEQGLAALAASSLTRGLNASGKERGMNATEMENFLSDRAARLSAGAGIQTFTLNWESPARFNSDMCGLVTALLRRPAFAQEEFARAGQSQLASIKSSEDQPFSLAMRQMFPFLFGDHPYGHMQLGRADKLPDFRVSDAKAFWERQKAENWVLTFCGDFNRDEIMAQAEKVSAALKPDEAKMTRTEPPSPAWGEKRELDLKLPGRNQAHFFLVFPTVPRMHEDSPGLMLLQSVLDGQSGLLFRDLRDRHSLGYTVSAFGWQADKAGAMIFYIGTEPGRLEEAKNGFARILGGLRSERLPAAELERGNRQLEGEYYRGRQTLASRKGEAASLAILNRPLDAERLMVAKAKELGPEDLRRLAEKYFDPSRAYQVIVQP